MKVTKIGHCCLLIEEAGLRILTDPGAYSTIPEDLGHIDIVLITHEHSDHLHLESLKAVIARSPKAKIITNHGVGKLLQAHNIGHEILSDGTSRTTPHLRLDAFGKEHAELYRDFGAVENTGYLINDKLFYPGDAFTVPPKPVQILALPVAGPWMRISDAVRYALAVKPSDCFPVHDAMLVPGRGNITRMIPGTFLPQNGIRFHPLDEGQSVEF